MNTWIVVTDASRARLFAANGNNEPPRLIRELSHNGSRLKGSDINTDRPGRGHNRVGTRRFSVADTKMDPHDVEAEHFAHELADLLEDGRYRRAFDQLAVAAPPQFLGLLRSTISGHVKKLLARSIDKDYTNEPTHDLSRQLKPIVDDIQAQQRRKEMGA